MKAILKTLLFILIVAILCQCRKDDPQVNIPDNNFLNALIELGVDTDGDGLISPAEAEVVTSLDVNSKDISDMTGIEAFVNLDTLICWDNQLTTLNVSNNTVLEVLICLNNQFASLDVSNNIILKVLRCSRNQITNLDVSNNPNLEYLECFHNQINNLNLNNNSVLKELNCFSNPLTSLDVSTNIALEGLYCSWNQLAILDVSHNTSLRTLYCPNNQLTNLDISENTALEWFDISNMPSLSKVCVWEMPFPPAGVTVDTTDSPNVYFTADCN